jgi:hypothetical protein
MIGVMKGLARKNFRAEATKLVADSIQNALPFRMAGMYICKQVSGCSLFLSKATNLQVVQHNIVSFIQSSLARSRSHVRAVSQEGIFAWNSP